jgi:hypothetical protein
MKHTYSDEFTIDRDNVVRWKSNNHVPFQDMLLEFLTDGLITTNQYMNSERQRGIDTSNFIFEYKEFMKMNKPNEEELFEMRSVFGEGEIVVNIITGESVKL